jgi:hypothetical protein
VVVVVVIFLMAETGLIAETPLTVPVLMGSPPLVVGMYDGSGVALGFGVVDGVGTIEGEVDGVAEGDGNKPAIKPVVALNVKNPTMPRAIIVRSPAINDFICPIEYHTYYKLSMLS